MKGYLVPATLLAILALPFLRYRRSRQAEEKLGDWLARTELHLLSSLGHDLRAATWLTPSLFLRSLFATARVTYGIFWLMALLMLFGDIVNLQWSWQKIDLPSLAGFILEPLLFFTLLGFWGLFGYGHARWPGYIDFGHLAWHWLLLLGYIALTVQTLPWFVNQPGIFIFRTMLASSFLPSAGAQMS